MLAQIESHDDEIRQLAFYDSLTRLPNRRLLLDRLQHALVSTARSGFEGALLFIDLDNFKDVNDTLGHDKGDLLLQEVAKRLTTCVREGDTVARLGGDEFVVLLEGLSESRPEGATHAEIVGEKVLAALNKTYQIAGQELHITSSIGATLFCGNANTVDELLRQADLAMYQAKEAGRNTLRFFDPELHPAITAPAALDKALREVVRATGSCSDQMRDKPRASELVAEQPLGEADEFWLGRIARRPRRPDVFTR